MLRVKLFVRYIIGRIKFQYFINMFNFLPRFSEKTKHKMNPK